MPLVFPDPLMWALCARLGCVMSTKKLEKDLTDKNIGDPLNLSSVSESLTALLNLIWTLMFLMSCLRELTNAVICATLHFLTLFFSWKRSSFKWYSQHGRKYCTPSSILLHTRLLKYNSQRLDRRIHKIHKYTIHKISTWSKQNIHILIHCDKAQVHNQTVN